MISVSPRPEPDTFEARVRAPGRQALAEDKNPLPDYWRRCSRELLEAYDRICAYSCFHIPRVVGGATVEHFAPKSARRDLAYEWSNYRVVCALMNARKREFEDVLDPFEIDDDWFELELAFMQVRPAERLGERTTQAVLKTIDRLKLNDVELCRAREDWYDDWIGGQFTASYMARHAPFIYREAVRQGKAPK